MVLRQQTPKEPLGGPVREEDSLVGVKIEGGTEGGSEAPLTVSALASVSAWPAPSVSDDLKYPKSSNV